MEIDEREKKLPKWAQAELERLRLRLGETREALAEERGNDYNPDLPNVGVGSDGENGGPGRLYDPRTRVRFRMGEGIGNYIEVYWRKDVQGTRLYICGGDRITIHPSASNAIALKLERYPHG